MTDAATIVERKNAAAQAAARLVGPGMAVGLGHGSTAVAVVPFLAERAGRGELAGTAFVPAARYMAQALRAAGDDRNSLCQQCHCNSPSCRPSSRGPGSAHHISYMMLQNWTSPSRPTSRFS